MKVTIPYRKQYEFEDYCRDHNISYTRDSGVFIVQPNSTWNRRYNIKDKKLAMKLKLKFT